MQKYLNQVRHLQFGFESFILSQIPRSRNTHADSPATLATSSAQSLPRVILVEDLCKPAKEGGNGVHIHQISIGLSWMDSIVLFLKEDVLLESKFEAKNLHPTFINREEFLILCPALGLSLNGAWTL